MCVQGGKRGVLGTRNEQGQNRAKVLGRAAQVIRINQLLSKIYSQILRDCGAIAAIEDSCFKWEKPQEEKLK